jgi:PAS domain S-box-containing protein
MIDEKPTYQELEKEIEFLREKIRQNGSEEKFTSYFENNKAIMLQIDTQTKRIINANSSTAFFYGFSKEELLQKTIYDFQTLLPEEVDSRMKQAAQNKSNYFEFQHKIANGEIKDVQVYASPFKFDNQIHMVITIYDITEQKSAARVILAAKEKAVESEEKFKQLAENMKEVFWLHTDNEMLYVNPAFENVFGLPCQALYDNPQIFTEIIYEEDKSVVLNIFKSETFKETGTFNYDYRITRPDKQIRWINAKSYPIRDENGTVIKRAGLATDITEKKQFEIELINAKEKAEESDRLKTAFLQNMSHEIRTPMNAIIGFSKMLDKPELSTEKRKSFTSIIVNSTNQLLSIVTDILTISAIETKQEKLFINKVCINNIITELLTIYKTQSQNQNILLYSKQQLTDKQSEIYTDKTKLTQVLTNLLTNAFKFTQKGFIEFGYILIANELEFYVKDSGIGISAELHEKIFERFRQADKSIQTNYGGTGLGLSISKGFVELLGGRIWVQSEREKGSSFYFTIPYKPVYEINTPIEHPLKHNNSVTILVAEDDEYNFLYIKELLIKSDITLIHAKDGKETIEICQSNEDINLILMDIKMPIMDGYSAAKLIKEFRPNLPIIAQSAYALTEDREKYKGTAFDDFVAKPINAEKLKCKLLKYIDIQTNKCL